MAIEQNKALVRGLYATVFNGKNLAAIDDYVAAGVTDQSLPPGAPTGIAGVRQMISMFTTAFPDLQITVEELVAEGEQVVARWTMRATPEKAGIGMPPTGERVTLPGISILRLASGKSVSRSAVSRCACAARRRTAARRSARRRVAGTRNEGDDGDLS